MICGSGGSKSSLAKAAGAEPAGQMRDEKLHAVVARSAFPSQNAQSTPVSNHFWKLRCRKSTRRCGAKHISKSKCTKHLSSGPLLEVEMLKKCTPLWREAHFQVKMYKTHHARTTFGSWDVEKVHAVVAGSTFPSENVQNTPCWDHFWKLRCWKSARRCGAKRISKSKCTKHTSFEPLLEVAMSKKYTPLWREAHFEVKMHKAPQLRTAFGSWDVEKVHAVVARSTFPSENVQNTPCSDHFWKLRCWKSARRCGPKHISKWKCSKHTILGPLLEVEMLKKCTPLWREAHFQVKMHKAHQFRTTFGSCDVEKVHAVVARSTFRSQNVQSTSAPDRFWKLRCWKSARRCSGKHISKWKCTKHTMLGPLLEVEMLKKCTPLWPEAHFQVKMYKTHHAGTTFGSWDVEKVHAVVARSTFRSQNVQNTKVWTTFGGSDVASLHYTTQPYTTLHSTTLRFTTLNYITQHYNYNYTTTIHYTLLHYTTLHYSTLQYTTLHYLPLHFTTLHSTTLQLQLQLHNYTPLQYTPLQCTTLNYSTLHHITLHYTPLHYITLH